MSGLLLGLGLLFARRLGFGGLFGGLVLGLLGLTAKGSLLLLLHHFGEHLLGLGVFRLLGRSENALSAEVVVSRVVLVTGHLVVRTEGALARRHVHTRHLGLLLRDHPREDLLIGHRAFVTARLKHLREKILVARALRGEGHVLDGEEVHAGLGRNVLRHAVIRDARKRSGDLTLGEVHQVEGLILDGADRRLATQHRLRDADALRGLDFHRGAKLAARLLRHARREVVLRVRRRVPHGLLGARKRRVERVRVGAGVRVLGPRRRVTVLVGVGLGIGVRGGVNAGLLVPRHRGGRAGHTAIPRQSASSH